MHLDSTWVIFKIPLGPSVGVWESLMRQMAIDIHLPSADMDKGVEEFVALPMQPASSPVVNHTCDPNVRRPCSTEPEVGEIPALTKTIILTIFWLLYS